MRLYVCGHDLACCATQGPSKLSSHGLSQSYTEARLAEEELFEGIIRKTEHNLINAGDLQEDYAGSTRNAMQRLVECKYVAISLA